jgi:hypothetical protein
VAIYLVGHAAFLWQLGLRGIPHRLIAAVLVLATVPLGHVLAVAQLGAVVAIMVTTAIIEDVPEMRRTGGTAIGDFGRSANLGRSAN